MAKAKSNLVKFYESKAGRGVAEALRWAVFAFVSVFVGKLLELTPSMELSSNFEVYLTMGLRLADSLLHKTDLAKKGLARF